jgi:hypothetical protein
LVIYKEMIFAWHCWLTTVVLASQEADIRRITVLGQPGQTVHETLSLKKTSEKRAGGVAQGAGPKFKPSFQQKKKEKRYDSLEF